MSFKKSSLCWLQGHFLNPSAYRACQHGNGPVCITSGIESYRHSICNEMPTALLGLENWSYITAFLRFKTCALSCKPVLQAVRSKMALSGTVSLTSHLLLLCTQSLCWWIWTGLCDCVVYRVFNRNASVLDLVRASLYIPRALSTNNFDLSLTIQWKRFSSVHELLPKNAADSWPLDCRGKNVQTNTVLFVCWWKQRKCVSNAHSRKHIGD